jgi:hypothetical protein
VVLTAQETVVADMIHKQINGRVMLRQQRLAELVSA